MKWFFDSLRRWRLTAIAFVHPIQNKLNRKRFDGMALLRLRAAAFTRRRLRLRLVLSAGRSHKKTHPLRVFTHLFFMIL